MILHKELDADDGELTRTRKVRRNFIAERYGPLVDALFSDADSHRVSRLRSLSKTAVKAMIRADLKICVRHGGLANPNCPNRRKAS